MSAVDSTPQPAEAQPRTSYGTGLIGRLRRLIGTPARLVLLANAVADVAGGVAAIAGGLSTGQSVTLVGVLGLLTAKSTMFVKGWQLFEKAMYEDNLTANEQARQHEAMAAMSARPRPGSGLVPARLPATA